MMYEWLSQEQSHAGCQQTGVAWCCDAGQLLACPRSRVMFQNLVWCLHITGSRGSRDNSWRGRRLGEFARRYNKLFGVNVVQLSTTSTFCVHYTWICQKTTVCSRAFWFIWIWYYWKIICKLMYFLSLYLQLNSSCTAVSEQSI